jgi:sulfite exporter TauE/SafE
VTDDLAGWCEQQQTTLKQQLELLRSGRMRTWEQYGTGVGMVDTTADRVHQIQKSLADLAGILNRSAR